MRIRCHYYVLVVWVDRFPVLFLYKLRFLPLIFRLIKSKSLEVISGSLLWLLVLVLHWNLCLKYHSFSAPHPSNTDPTLSVLGNWVWAAAPFFSPSVAEMPAVLLFIRKIMKVVREDSTLLLQGFQPEIQPHYLTLKCDCRSWTEAGSLNKNQAENSLADREAVLESPGGTLCSVST